MVIPCNVLTLAMVIFTMCQLLEMVVPCNVPAFGNGNIYNVPFSGNGDIWKWGYFKMCQLLEMVIFGNADT